MTKGLASEIREAAEADLLFKRCVPCDRLLPVDRFSNNKARKDGKATQCKECSVKYHSSRRATDADYRLKCCGYSKKYRANNPKYTEYNKLWNKENRARRNYLTTKRYTTKKNACPKWLNDDQKTRISEFYWLAQDLKAVTGEDYEVDHIVPLQGKEVCGLHVPWNLQVLPSDLNRKKSNS